MTNKFHSGKLCSAPPTKVFPYAVVYIITYGTKLIVLLCTINVTHNMLILFYKSLFLTNYPIYMKNMFTLRSTIISIIYAVTIFWHSLYVKLLLMAVPFFTMPPINGTHSRTLYSPFRFIRHLSHENFCGEVLTFNFKQLKLAGYVGVMILCLSPWSQKIRVRELT